LRRVRLGLNETAQRQNSCVHEQPTPPLRQAYRPLQHTGNGCTLRRVRLGLKETAQRQKSVQSRHTNSLRRRCGKPTSHCNTLGRLYLAEGAAGTERDGTEAEERPESTELVVGRRVVGGHSHQLAVELVA